MEINFSDKVSLLIVKEPELLIIEFQVASFYFDSSNKKSNNWTTSDAHHGFKKEEFKTLSEKKHSH